MKKLLLSLAVVLGMSSVASAVEVALPGADKTWQDYEWTQSGSDFVGVVENYTLSLNKNTSTSNLVSPDQYSIRVYAGANLTVTAPEGITFTKVTVKINSTGNKATAATASTGWTVSDFENGVFTMTAATPQSTITFDGAGKQLRVGSMVIEASGEGGTPVVPPTPPTPDVTEVANIAAMMALDKDTKVKFTSPVTVLWQHDNYTYIHDNSGNTLVFGNLSNEYTNGMTIPAGIEGTIGEYNGLKQLVPEVSTFAAGTAGAAVEPEVLQVEEVAADLAYAYVKFVGVEISGSARSFTMTDASGSVTLYQQWTNIEVPTGSNLNVVGFIGLYKGNAQVLCAEVTTATGQEVVAAPTFSVAAGAVPAGTEVAISCATEGATIYYTVDGTTPTAASAVYSAPVVINEALTLQAIAVKEGMDDSNVATAVYTIKAVTPVTGTTAEFNFADPSTLDPAYALDGEGFKADGTTGNSYYDLTGVVFTSNGIELINVSTGTAPRLYYQGSSAAWSYRFYKKSETTISCQTGYKITAVEFATQTSSHATALGKCTFSEGELVGNELTIAEDKTVTSIVISNVDAGTVGLTGITVTFEGISGIADVEINENAPVEFFNLQGVRVQGDLTPGLYIRRQGNNATKVLVK